MKPCQGRFVDIFLNGKNLNVYTVNCHCDTQWRVGVTAERKTFYDCWFYRAIGRQSGYMADPSLQGMFD